jgi:hypothetical protein
VPPSYTNTNTYNCPTERRRAAFTSALSVGDWSANRNRRKRPSKLSSATSTGLPSRSSNRADRLHWPQPSGTHYRRGHSNRAPLSGPGALVHRSFLCSALVVHHGSLQAGLPSSVGQPFSATHFPRHCFRLIPASGSVASSAFSVPPLKPLGSLP